MIFSQACVGCSTMQRDLLCLFTPLLTIYTHKHPSGWGTRFGGYFILVASLGQINDYKTKVRLDMYFTLSTTLPTTTHKSDVDILALQSQFYMPCVSSLC